MSIKPKRTRKKRILPMETAIKTATIQEQPELTPPEEPSFIEGKEWSYNAQDIEDFRLAYKEFRRLYAEYKKALS